MKKTIQSFKYCLVFLFFALLNTTLALAQDGGGEDAGSVTVSKTTSSSSTTSQDWYTNPWIWVVGGAVFILLLIALVKGNSSKTDVHRTTVTKDVKTD